jgi:hypothetical protein
MNWGRPDGGRKASSAIISTPNQGVRPEPYVAIVSRGPSEDRSSGRVSFQVQAEALILFIMIRRFRRSRKASFVEHVKDRVACLALIHRGPRPLSCSVI